MDVGVNVLKQLGDIDDRVKEESGSEDESDSDWGL